MMPVPPDRGLVLVLSGPSGVGKGTLIAHLLSQVPEVGFSISATTRSPRPGERDGVDYDFLSAERFEALVREGAFLEHAEVYGRRYGTLRARVEAQLALGQCVLLDIDAQGSFQVRATLPEAVHVFVAPPSRQELERRLRSRATEDETTIQRRMQQADAQLQAAPSYDYVLINDDLHAARLQIEAIVRAERVRASRIRPRLEALLLELAAP